MAGILSNVVVDGLPENDPAEMLNFLTQDNGTFIGSEGDNWDFKESWPFSYSDNYFLGICRLICAFANTAGGIIIFGIHDRTRKAGHNKVSPNLDKLHQAFRQITGRGVTLEFRHYETKIYGIFDILLVKPIQPEDMPLSFVKICSGYPANVKWVREGNEVISAEPRHLALLYCRTSINLELEDLGLEGQLPPSPSTIRRFIGRMNTIDRIFDWLKKSDQPRNFLYGKGGSGKSTIAFEIARTLKGAGGGFELFDGSKLEKVIFISAKMTELNVDSQKQVTFKNNDFHDERTLYEAILIEGGANLDSCDGISVGDLKKEIMTFLNFNSVFMVIDDIDTLTTAGIDAGFDFLYGALCRAKRSSKVLYTLRNVPTHSLSNSIEVPGLEIGTEYEQFVRLCADQFNVEEPEHDFVKGRLIDLSERRPLVVESIIALRRHSDSYSRAAMLFEQQGGDDVRSYVFRREWEAIPILSRGRDLLAALSLYGKAINYDDLVDLMQFDTANLHEAIASVQEMFLKVELDRDSSTYQLSPLTNAFVASASCQLDIYGKIKARVQKYKTNIYAEDPALSRLTSRIHRLLAEALRTSGKTASIEAWQLLMSDEHSHAITQDPRYMALCGFAALRQVPTRLVEARTYFENSFAMRYSPDIKFIREWFRVERDTDLGDKYTGLIFDLVIKAKGYSEAYRAEFTSKRAAFLYNIARQNIPVEPARSVERLQQALILNARAFRSMAKLREPMAEQVASYTRNTAFYLFQQFVRAGRHDDVIVVIGNCASAPGVALDPLEEAIQGALSEFVLARATRPERQRWAGKLANLSKPLKLHALWLDAQTGIRVSQAIDATAKNLRLEN